MSYMKQQWLEQEQTKAEWSWEVELDLRFGANHQGIPETPDPPQLTEEMLNESFVRMFPKHNVAVESSRPSGIKHIVERAAREFYGPPPNASVPKDTRVREKDKPEGTRDVEKFLREQQEAIWRND